MVFDALQERARQDYYDSLSAGTRWRLFNKIRRKPSHLLSYNDVVGEVQITGRHDEGVRTVPSKDIVGSVGRTHDFDRDFHPLNEDSRERWCGVAGALYAGKDIPPIDLYKIGAAYFVIDGNHRVSVMRHNGQEYIEAHVIELDTPDCIDLLTGEPGTCFSEN